MNPVEAFQGALKRFAHIRQTQGDEAWHRAIHDHCVNVLAGRDPSFEPYVQSFMDGLDFIDQDEVRKDAARLKASPPQDPFMAALQQQMPALKSQAQFNAFMASFEALRAVANGIFAQDVAAASRARAALDTSFEALKKVTEVTLKLEEVPEAATSKAAEDFKRPPAQFGEYDVQRQLLSELEHLPTVSALNEWYVANRGKIDTVVSPTLRNPLLDAIRARKLSMSQQGQS